MAVTSYTETSFCIQASTWPRGRQLFWGLIHIFERVVAAAALLFLVLPLIAVILVVRFKSKLPPMVAHKRVGLGGRELWILKVRTMWPAPRVEGTSRWIEYLRDCEVPESKAIPDPRVTSGFARLLRRHSIDEWPQLWQVVTGALHLVGPRALTDLELKRHYGDIAVILSRTKPGLIGLWQVRGRDRLTYKQRCRLDLFMLEKWSFRLYCYILVASISAILSGRNAS